jgi:cell division protein FtsQ
MKRHSILERQSVLRRKANDSSRSWKIIRLIGSMFFKVLLMLIGMISISLLFLYLYGYLVSSPYVKLEEVIVTGVDEDIKQGMIELSGLNSDSSMLTINLNDIKNKMERHPWVRSAELEKRFPHTLIVKAEKETVTAVVLLDRLFYMNGSGILFKEVEEEEDRDYPLITGISGIEEVRDNQLKTAAFVLDLFRTETGEWSRDQISELHVSADGDVSLYSISLPTVIRMGRDELEEKKDDLKRITEHLKKTGKLQMVKIIDLNYRDGVVVSFSDAG